MEKRQDIPIPEPRRDWKSTLDTMEVGESFFAPANHQMGSILTKASKRTGYTFARKREIEDGVAGRRVWRIR